MEPRDNYHRKMFKELYERNVHKDNRKLTEIMADFYADKCPLIPLKSQIVVGVDYGLTPGAIFLQNCGAKKEQS